MVIKRLFIWLFATLAVAAVSLNAYDLPEIESAVTTEFGVYEPVAVDVSPALGELSVAADFSNVAFFENFSSSFDNQALEILGRNHFVAVPGGFKQIHDLYNWAGEEDLPGFVTTDCMLHTFHIVYDYALRILETERFQYDLFNLNEALLADLRLRSSSDPALAEELRRVVAFVAVARKLARPESDVPEEAADLVAAELSLIDSHEGPEVSPIFGYREDYSQYVPRGHYTRSQALENYFRAMMWYGRMGFRLRPGERPEEIEKGRSETRMALNLVAGLSGLDVQGEPALDVWERIYRPTVFFVGSADDLTAGEYAELAAEVYGKAAELLTPEEIAESTLLQNFIDQAMELRSPRINSSLLAEGDASVVTKGFRVMGQRFIPDSYVLWKLVFPNVYGRLMPRGLDVMAGLRDDAGQPQAAVRFIPCRHLGREPVLELALLPQAAVRGKRAGIPNFYALRCLAAQGTGHRPGKLGAVAPRYHPLRQAELLFRNVGSRARRKTGWIRGTRAGGFRPPLRACALHAPLPGRPERAAG